MKGHTAVNMILNESNVKFLKFSQVWSWGGSKGLGYATAEDQLIPRKTELHDIMKVVRLWLFALKIPQLFRLVLTRTFFLVSLCFHEDSSRE